MLAAGNLALRSARRSAGAAVPAGPAMATVTAVAARTAVTIRCLALGYVVVQVVIWRSFFAADPVRLAGPAVAIACAAGAAAGLRSGAPGWRLIGADSLVQVALALVAVWCVPPPMRGDTANWLFVSMAGQLLTPAWFAPSAAVAPLALASGAAYWAGAVASPVPGSGVPAAADNSPLAAGVFLLTTAVVAWCGLRAVGRRAAAVDTALAGADRQSRAQYVRLLRDVEGREHDRLLHDTILNTLTVLGRPAAATDDAAGRARLDVTLMERALDAAGGVGGTGGPGELGGTGGTGGTGETADGGLLDALSLRVAAMAGRGLTVHLDVARRVADWAQAPLSSAPLVAPVMPGRVAAALAQAAGEALANVARHAGTDEAWVAVRPCSPASGSAGSAGTVLAGVSVVVRDEGAGFDPDRIGPDRLGVRRSIVERVADWGGRATIESAPGAGTVVSLAWTAGEPAW